MAYPCRFDIFKGIAEVPPSLLAMVTIVTEAEPAELIAALGASHVHASLVLLDGDFAFGARLGVELEPNFCVVVSLVDSCEPFGEVCAVNGPVGLFDAAEAPIIAAFFTYDVCLMR